MTLVLILLGALPFVFGGVQNWYMTTHMDSLLPYTLIAFAVLLIWGLLAFFFNHDGTRTKRIVVFLNLIAAVDLFLIGVQELILHAFWMNLIGAWSQFFYLPVLRLGFSLTSWSPRMFPAYAASFLLMAGASILGCKLRKKWRCKRG